jgi:hypothetical protein
MNKGLLALIGCAAFVTAAGCTPAAREDVGQAGDNLGQAAQKSAEGTAQAVDKAGDKVAEESKEAVQDTQRAAANAGAALGKAGDKIAEESKEAVRDTQRAAANAGQTIQREATQAGQAVERGAANVADATKEAGATVALTPKVRNAIVAGSTSNIPGLNVDTKADSKQVIITGNATSKAQHDKAISDARKALADSKSDYKLVDQLKVGGGASK